MPDDRLRGVGPFTVAKPLGDADKTATVVDIAGQTFCTVHSGHCVGGDLTAAKDRAQRIVEALNKSDLTVMPLLSFDAAQKAGKAMHDRWVNFGEGVPPLSHNDAAWPDMFRAGYEAIRNDD